MIGAGDRQDDVREEGKAGLRPPRVHEQPQLGEKVGGDQRRCIRFLRSGVMHRVYSSLAAAQRRHS